MMINGWLLIACATYIVISLLYIMYLHWRMIKRDSTVEFPMESMFPKFDINIPMAQIQPTPRPKRPPIHTDL